MLLLEIKVLIFNSDILRFCNKINYVCITLQLKKLQDRVSKAKDSVSRSKDAYDSALQDLNNYNAKYMEDMTDVFERCQRMEAQRLKSFKESLFMVQKCLNISNDPMLAQIYEEFYHTVNNSDPEKDLTWWSNTHGVNMAMNWPQFEACTTSTSRDQRNSNVCSVKGARHSNVSELSRTTNNSEYKSALSNLSNEGEDEGDEWDENSDGEYIIDAVIDTSKPGVLVRALYDYEAGANDELDFKTGDLFEKLEEEDEQGWSKGRKDGKVGFYPANYIE